MSRRHIGFALAVTLIGWLLFLLWSAPDSSDAAAVSSASMATKSEPVPAPLPSAQTASGSTPAPTGTLPANIKASSDSGQTDRFAALFLPVNEEPDGLQQRMRHIAIRQANAMALAALPADVVHLLTELKFVEAAQLLKKLAEQGYTGADRMLVSMAMDRRPNAICFPYTEIVAKPVPVLDLASHERQLRNTLSAVPPELSGRLAKTAVLFDRVAVLAACSELTIDLYASLERLAANAGVDDEDRLFVEPFVVSYGLSLPERVLDTDGNDRPPYSRAGQAKLASTLRMAWWQFTDRTEHYKLVTTAAVAAEPHAELFGLAGSILLDRRNPALSPEHRAKGLGYLAVASERGDRLGLESYGTELMRHAENIEHGYMLSLFARHLNARGCYPGDYLQEWERQYRYIEEQAQAMSPVTLEIVQEKAAKYIKANAMQAYDHLHCRS